jgi:hypothetical protein
LLSFFKKGSLPFSLFIFCSENGMALTLLISEAGKMVEGEDEVGLANLLYSWEQKTLASVSNNVLNAQA